MIRDSLRGYGWVSILFHWASAALVIFILGLGLYLPRYGYHSPNFLRYAHLHYGLGILIFGLFALRLCWRLSSRSPAPLSTKPATRAVIKAIKVMLYTVVFVVICSGFLICTSDGQSVDVLGLFAMPSLMSMENAGVNIAGLTHKYLAWLLCAIVVLHAAAALLHHFVVGDRTLLRMLTPK
jgi:cytochrome b561